MNGFWIKIAYPILRCVFLSFLCGFLADLENFQRVIVPLLKDIESTRMELSGL